MLDLDTMRPHVCDPVAIKAMERLGLAGLLLLGESQKQGAQLIDPA